MAVTEGLDDVQEWMKRAIEAAEVNDLIVAYDDDAYKYAKNLEDRGWNVNAALVHVLGGIGLSLANAHEKLVKAWVIFFDVTGSFADGDLVDTRTHKRAKVARVRAEKAELLIQPLEGEWSLRDGGVVIPFEDARATEANAAAEELA